jgi:hypothetical protein
MAAKPNVPNIQKSEPVAGNPNQPPTTLVPPPPLPPDAARIERQVAAALNARK